MVLADWSLESVGTPAYFQRYPELKMLTDAVASSKIISAKKSEELVQKLCCLASTHQAEQLQKFAALSSRVKPHNEKVYYIIDNIQTAIGNHLLFGTSRHQIFIIHLFVLRSTAI